MGSKTLTLAALLCCLGLWGCKARYLAGDEVGLKQRRELIEQVEELRAAQASCLAEAKGSLDDLEAEELEDGPEVAGRIRASLGEILRSVEQLEESSDRIYARWDAAIAKAEPEVLAEKARERRGQTLERQQQVDGQRRLLHLQEQLLLAELEGRAADGATPLLTAELRDRGVRGKALLEASMDEADEFIAAERRKSR